MGKSRLFAVLVMGIVAALQPAVADRPDGYVKVQLHLDPPHGTWVRVHVPTRWTGGGWQFEWKAADHPWKGDLVPNGWPGTSLPAAYEYEVFRGDRVGRGVKTGAGTFVVPLNKVGRTWIQTLGVPEAPGADSVQVDVRVRQHDGEPLAGAVVSHLADGVWQDLGITDVAGVVEARLDEGTHRIRAEVGGTWAERAVTVRDRGRGGGRDRAAAMDNCGHGDDDTVDFFTTQMTVAVISHEHRWAEGAAVAYEAGSWRDCGVTSDRGIVRAELFGTIDLRWRAQLAGAESLRTATVPGDGATPWLFGWVWLCLPAPPPVDVPVPVTLTLDPPTGTHISVDGGPRLGSPWQQDLLPGTYAYTVGRTGPTDTQTGAGSFTVVKDTPYSATITVPELVTTVTVNAHDGTPLPGARVWYNDGGWHLAGLTDETGKISHDALRGGLLVQVDVGGTSAQQTIGDCGLVFHTTGMTVTTRDGGGVPLPGVAVYYDAGGWHNIGNTADDGTVSVELFPKAALPWYAGYRGTSQTRLVDVPGDGIAAGCTAGVDFSARTTTISVLTHDGRPLPGAAIYYDAGGWQYVGVTATDGTAACELLGEGPWLFHAGYGGTSSTRMVSAPGATFHTTALELWAHRADESVLPGALMWYNAGGWHGVGTTAGAVVAEVFPTTDMPVQAQYGGTSATRPVTVEGDGATANVVSVARFYTTSVTLTAADGTGAAVDGVTMWHNAGGWRQLGVTAGGSPVAADMFAGSYEFQANYRGTQSNLIGEAINGEPTGATSGVTDTVAFSLTKVTLWYHAAGANVYYSASGWQNVSDWTSFWVFPGTYTFSFGHSGLGARIPLTIAGGTYRASVALIKVLDSSGQIIAPSAAQVYWSGWQDATVDAVSRLAVAVVPSASAIGSTSFAAQVGNSRQEKTQSIATDSVVVFRAMGVRITLCDSAGQALSAPAEYYTGAWHSVGDTPAVVPLLPGTYYFAVTYNGMRQQKSQTITSDLATASVAFETVPTTVALADSGATPISAPAQFYTGVWQDMPTTNVAKELLPGSYYFRVTLNGMTQQKSHVVPDGAASAAVPFQTVLTTVSLVDSAGTTPVTAPAQFYAGTWQDMPETWVAKELLPGSYYFRVTLNGMTQQKSQAIADGAGTAVVPFQTVLTTVTLVDSAGTAQIAAPAQFYAGTWQDMPETWVAKELLPGSYYFRVTLNGMTEQKSQAIDDGAGSAEVPFQTAKVTSTSNTCSQFYATVWQPFANGMELLPGSYYFRYPSGTLSQTVAGTTTIIP